jgi:hypothetical protein
MCSKSITIGFRYRYHELMERHESARQGLRDGP